MRSSKQIRSEFIKFFEDRGHKFVASSSLLPADDPTLLFANAGMNQFKGIFLGTEKREYNRAVNSQKCIRAGGKHNDLEDVGHDTYHHTFFEMLGNWSFGDYFKADAIQWAWELLTKVWGLPADRLHATVFGGDKKEGLEPDTEAADLWKKLTNIDPTHIHMGSKKDNFWEMGDTGPCGPCSEIHIDLTPDKSGGKLVNAGDRRVMEIWNLVFMQFNRGGDGKLSPLPATHVDTGMGFERICFVLQGKSSNYATDLFVPIIEKIETLTSHRYGAASGLADRFDVTSQENIGDVACRVIADHARALTFAIADGVIPSNEGRGYVLRRILRRAARYGRQYLNIEGTFVAKLVPLIVELMGDAFPEIQSRQQYVIDTIRSEEESFGKTLDRGIDLFDRQAQKVLAAGGKQLGGEVAFELHATYGFPIDLTQVMAGERGMTVDMKGYEDAKTRHEEVSRGAGDTFKVEAVANLPPTDDSAKYSPAPLEAKVLGWAAGGKFISSGTLNAGEQAAIVLDQTNFYGEQGGQVGDTGEITFPGGRFVVRSTAVAGQSVLHNGSLESGTLRVGTVVTARVDASRFDIMRNHTGTHLLNWALRKVLGDHINQAGSIVAADRLRFDFTHNQALTDEQTIEVERLVNEQILADMPVLHKIMPLAAAKQLAGVRAVFGEKYPDPVRVIWIGPAGDKSAPLAADEMCAIEFCGGTHLQRTSQVGLFKIVGEESVAKGVRRITAVSGHAAVQQMQQLDAAMRAATSLLRCQPADVAARVESMQKEIKQLKKAKPAGGAAGEFAPEHTAQTPAGNIVVGRLDGADAAALRTLCDVQRQKGAAAVFVGGVAEDKVTLIAMVNDEVVAGGKLKAGDWVKAIAPIVGGSGGGKPNLAQAGGKQPEKLAEALAKAIEFAQERLG